jgi:hypothetical protein
MLSINCSLYDAGQSAFRNGMHDAYGGLPIRSPLYRNSWWKNLGWRAGWIFQRATGLAEVKSLKANAPLNADTTFEAGFRALEVRSEKQDAADAAAQRTGVVVS